MRPVHCLLAASLVLAPLSLAAQRPTEDPRHVDVYKVAARFGGWPANHGIWSWGDEILVGFEAGHFRNTDRGHAIDYTQPAEHLLARSLDGGQTWAIERPAGLKPPPSVKVAGVPAEAGGREPVESPGGIDFAHPDFVFTVRMASVHTGPSRFYYSHDRGRTWNGPFVLPNLGQPGIAARTDYVVDGPQTMTLMVTAAKSNEREGRVVAARTTDGGKTWQMLGYVHPEPDESEYGIMPSTVRLSPTSLYTTVRFRRYIDAYRSDDNGTTWSHVVRPVPDTGRGNPPSLVRLRDGRLVLTYGYRAEPYGIRARVSTDEGRTWSDDVVLRADGGNWDLGYTRTVQRADGRLVTVYYYNLAADAERFIGATIWTP
jgi:hypothetical protein